MPEYDFSDWENAEPPDLRKWLHQELSALMNEVADGYWTCWIEDIARLSWRNRAEGDNLDEESLVKLSAEDFKEAVLNRLTRDYPIQDGAIWPSHREDIHEQWHKMRAPWLRAMDDIDRAVAEVLALPDRTRL